MTTRTEQLLSELAREAAERLPNEGMLKMQASGLRISRREEKSRRVSCVSRTSVGLIVRGRKEARMLDARLAYGAGACIVMSAELPDTFEAVGATHADPFLGLVLDIEEEVMRAVLAKLRGAPAGAGLAAVQGPRAASVFTAPDAVLDAFLRLLRLADEGADSAFIAPLVKEELYYRILTSPAAGAFRSLFHSGTPENRIREAAAWMRANYRRDFDMAEAAGRIGMSPATFYRRFREVIGASPRQYVKTLRLYEAERLMKEDGIDAAAAAFEVGYESAAYFSREFKRVFGLPPKQHVERARAQGEEAA